jgi:hypothetical protein
MSFRRKYRGLRSQARKYLKYHAQCDQRAATQAAAERMQQAAADAAGRRSVAARRGAKTRALQRQAARHTLALMPGQSSTRSGQAAQAPPLTSADVSAALSHSLLLEGKIGDALFTAAREGLPLQMAAICSSASIEDLNAMSDGLTPLHLVCQLTGEKARGALTCARVLVAKGARVDSQCARGCSALTYAQRAHNAELCSFLCGHGATA